MPFTELYSEKNQLAAGLEPDARAAAVYNTAWLPWNLFHKGYYLILTGEMAAGATFDALVQEAQDNAGTGAVAIAGKAITQLTQAGGDGNDICIIELKSEEFTPGFDHARLVVTVAAAAVDCCVLPIRGDSDRFAPVSVAAVTEIVN